MSNKPTQTDEACYTVRIPGTLADYSLTVPGRLPGLNEYTDSTRTHKQKGADMKRHFQNIVGWHIRAQLHNKVIDKPVFLLFTFYERDRRRDHDNVSSFARKVIQDALVKCGTLHDDGWDYVTGYMDRFAVDAKDPRIEVHFIEQEGKLKCKRRQNKSSCGSKK